MTEPLEKYAQLAAIVQQVQPSLLFALQVPSTHQLESHYYQIVFNVPPAHFVKRQDCLPLQENARKVSFVQVEINRNTKIYVPLVTIALLAQLINYLVVVQTSIKICKDNKHASVLVQRVISVQIVKGHNVSLKKVNYLSTAMAPRKLQSIAMLELTIQLMDQNPSPIARIVLQVTTVLMLQVKQR